LDNVSGWSTPERRCTKHSVAGTKAGFVRLSCMRSKPVPPDSIRIHLIESGGLYLATSSDVPTLWATSFDLEALFEEIDHAIGGHYCAIGFEGRAVQRAYAVEHGCFNFHGFPPRLEAAE
jgi:hypothetical protein